MLFNVLSRVLKHKVYPYPDAVVDLGVPWRALLTVCLRNNAGYCVRGGRSRCSVGGLWALQHVRVWGLKRLGRQGWTTVVTLVRRRNGVGAVKVELHVLSVREIGRVGPVGIG